MEEETIVSRNVVHNSQFAETMNRKYTTIWQLIRIPSKTKDECVQQFCSTCTIHPLGTCEEGFFIALLLLEIKNYSSKKILYIFNIRIFFTMKNKLIMVSS